MKGGSVDKLLVVSLLGWAIDLDKGCPQCSTVMAMVSLVPGDEAYNKARSSGKKKREAEERGASINASPGG